MHSGRITIGRLVRIRPRQREDVPRLKYEAFLVAAGRWEPKVAIDSEGRIWVRLAVKEHPFLSRYEGGRWTDFADPTSGKPIGNPGQVLAGPGMLQPLFRGAMLAVDPASRRAFLFDGEEWKAYDRLQPLVEEPYAWLRTHLTGGGAATGDAAWTRGYRYPYGQHDGQPWPADATGHIWVDGDAYDGRKRGKTPRGHVLMNAAGDRVVAGGILHDCSVWPPKELAAVQGQCWFDRQGRLWSAGPKGMCRFQDGRFHDLPSGHRTAPGTFGRRFGAVAGACLSMTRACACFCPMADERNLHTRLVRADR